MPDQQDFPFARQIQQRPFPPVSRHTDPATSHEAERKLNRSGRRRGQIAAILERLRRGPATNTELAALSLKYTGRISDLRAQGFDIECRRQQDEGATVYVLTGEPQ